MHEKRIPSKEKPWLKWYVEGAHAIATESFENVTLYQMLSRQLRKDGDEYPAFVYFGTKISRSELLARTDRWARMFRGMGVGEDDRVIVFVPFTPEAAYIIFALNKIGACAVLLNLGSGPEALSHGCAGARFAVVCDAVENSIAHALRNNPAFEHVILTSVSTDASFPISQVLRLKYAFARKKMLRTAKNYITSEDALQRWGGYEGVVEAPCDVRRLAIVTSTSGTSRTGYAKQVMNSNGAVVSMIKQTEFTGIWARFSPGDLTYTGLPPFISTSILALFLIPLYLNQTCCIDPRMGAGVFTRNLLKYRPQMCLVTGRCWVYFFSRIERMLRRGKKVDLSFFKIPIMGGEGIAVKDLRWMNSILRRCGGKYGMVSGYGMSEMFSLLTVDIREGFASDNDSESVITVGVPLPGSEVAIMDENGNELGYGECGEVCACGMTLMEGYYNDRQQTEKAVRDGWYHSGDLGYMDEDGYLYVFGRLSCCYVDEKGRRFQPFGLEKHIENDDDVHYCMVNNMAPDGEKPRLAMHLVLMREGIDRDALIRRIDKESREFLGSGQFIEGYKIHRNIFKMNKVLKMDRRYYREQLTGYIRPEEDEMVTVSF